MSNRFGLSVLIHWRSDLVKDLTGDVLEIGVGKGENLGYYRMADRVWSVEPDQRRAEDARRTAGSTGVRASVEVATAENLPYAENSFDQVVCSLVFCSVENQRQALAEIRRVLKPGGTLHMVEHVRPGNPLLAKLAEAITPWWSQVAYNCHLDRPTIDVLRQEAWDVAVHRRLAVFVHLSATNLRLPDAF